ncbi:uncharacterized [Tachysurus ichikawai]
MSILTNINADPDTISFPVPHGACRKRSSPSIAPSLSLYQWIKFFPVAMLWRAMLVQIGSIVLKIFGKCPGQDASPPFLPMDLHHNIHPHSFTFLLWSKGLQFTPSRVQGPATDDCLSSDSVSEGEHDSSPPAVWR